MTKDIKFRYRNKEGKIQVQKLENGKWISRTLPTPEVTFNWLCPIVVSGPSVQKQPETDDKVRLINIKRMDTLTPEEIEKGKKALNDLMSQILPAQHDKSDTATQKEKQ